MRALIINDEVKESLRQLRTFAEENFLDEEQMQKIANGEQPPVGDSADYTREIPMGYRVVYSVDKLPNVGWTRRASISVDGGPEKLPSPPAVEQIISMLGHDLESADYTGVQEIKDENDDVVVHRAVMVAFVIDREST